MTGITATLAELEREADGIWGLRARQSRAYIQAATVYEINIKAMRNQLVRPKTWSDARQALEQANAEQQRLERERQTLLTEQRRLDRLRRIGPSMRRRAELRALLDASQHVVELAPAREERLLATLAEAEEAERARQAAATLLAEVEDAIARIPADPTILAQAELIDRLAERRGTIEDARAEGARLEVERKGKVDRATELRRDFGLREQDLPGRPFVARLRTLVRDHFAAMVEVRTIGQAEEASATGLLALEERLAVEQVSAGNEELARAVEAARRLGEDIDQRF